MSKVWWAVGLGSWKLLIIGSIIMQVTWGSSVVQVSNKTSAGAS